MDSRDSTRMNPSEPPGIMMGSNYGHRLSSQAMPMPNSAGPMQGMHLSFSSMPSSTSKPADVPITHYNGDGSLGMRPPVAFSISEPVKKKRGRPRKYGPDGSVALALTPSFSVSGYPDGQSSEPSAKRRGRPPGSGKKQQLEALGAAGSSFTPHILTVNPGENVASKILAFSQRGPRTVCIIAASGVVCSVALRQPAISGGTVTYEGCFEIISLSGSYLLTEDGDTRSRSGGLSVALGSSDGRVLGGGVAGVLMAATPVQVIVGSFNPEGKKPKANSVISEPSSAPLYMSNLGGGHPVGSPTSWQQSVDESSSDDDDDDDGSDDAGSPLNQNDGIYENSSQRHAPSMSGYMTVSWSHSLNQPRQ